MKNYIMYVNRVEFLNDLDYVIEAKEVLNFIRSIKDEMKKFRYDNAYEILTCNLMKLEMFKEEVE